MGINRIFLRNRTEQETGRRLSVVLHPNLLKNLVKSQREFTDYMKKRYPFGTSNKGKIARMKIFDHMKKAKEA